MARVTTQASKPMLPLPKPVAVHHEHALESLQREWAARKKIPPVLLLTGLDGIGKRSLAYHLSQWILCEKSPFALEEESLFGGTSSSESVPSFSPCLECSACLKAIHGSWVDFTEIRSDSEDERGTLKVEQFRDLKTKMGFGAHEGAARITLIPNADRMTPQAANSMLKLLEEPPRGWVFLLTASDPTLILPTVLSRCQVVRLQPLPKEAILELLALASVPAERREIAAELAQGSWGKALKISDEASWERRDLVFRFLEEPGTELTPVVEWASGSPAELELLLNQLEHALSELVLWSQTTVQPSDYPWKNRDGSLKLASHASRIAGTRGTPGARDFWIERALRLGEIRRQSLAPLNRKILVQDLLMPWLR